MAAIDVLAARRDVDSVSAIADVLDDEQAAEELRRAAISAIQAIGGEAGARTLTGLVGKEQTDPTTMVAAIEALTALEHIPARGVIARRTHHDSPAVRAAALAALVVMEGTDAVNRLVGALADDDSGVRIAALRGLGQVQAADAVPLMVLAFADATTRTEAGIALGRIADRRALSVYLDSLVDRDPRLRDAAAGALLSLKADIVGDLRELASRNELPTAARRELAALYSQPEPIKRWRFLGAWSKEQREPEFDLAAEPDYTQTVQIGDREFEWQELTTDHPQGMIDPARYVDSTSNVWALAVTTIDRVEPGVARWMLGSDDQGVLWIDGQKVYEYLGDRGWSADQAHGEVQLEAGRHVIVFRNGNSGGGWQFSLSIGGTDPAFAFLNENVPPALDLTAYREFGLNEAGDAARGRELFHATDGIGCARCHSVGKETVADIGPNLLGVGAKYPREELIRSVLEPSNRIFSGYEMEVIETDAGETFQGVVRKETDTQLTLGDSRGELITIDLETIVFREKSSLSAMPNGLEKGMTLQDFADLVAYLESLTSEE
ncbi:MAG: HEAT repeat domain-containing protein [Pirellulaceae bacterium]